MFFNNINYYYIVKIYLTKGGATAKQIIDMVAV